MEESKRESTGDVIDINLTQVEYIATKHNMTTRQVIDIYQEVSDITKVSAKELTRDEIVELMANQLIILKTKEQLKEESLNYLIQACGADTNLISDGYHTFGELYEHRIELFIALCKAHTGVAWKSRVHSDGSVMEGWFIMGLYEFEGGQISYHLPEIYWDRCAFIRTRDQAPAWDRHTSADVLKRLREL